MSLSSPHRAHFRHTYVLRSFIFLHTIFKMPFVTPVTIASFFVSLALQCFFRLWADDHIKQWRAWPSPTTKPFRCDLAFILRSAILFWVLHGVFYWIEHIVKPQTPS